MWRGPAGITTIPCGSSRTTISLLAWTRPRVRASTRDPIYRVLFAWSLAGSGRRIDAARELEPLLQERLRAPYRVMLAETCVTIGDYDCAVAQIARTVAAAPYYTPAIVQLDPVWDPLRNRADFKKLIEAR